MKNIHMFPTDKPSKVHFDSKLFVSPNYQLSKSINSIVQGKNIYITSDEEINKETRPCWCVNTTKNTWNKDIIYYQGSMPQYHFIGFKKIILTTDQDLIKDGVQSIPDDFLEWFVKGQNINEIELEQIFSPDSIVYGINTNEYKVLIPEEQHKQDLDCPYEFTSRCTMGRCDCKPKQKTLEAAAEKFVKNTRLKNPKSIFCEGAKWQQERNYDDFKALWDFVSERWGNFLDDEAPQLGTFDEWFEKYKNK